MSRMRQQTKKGDESRDADEPEFGTCETKDERLSFKTENGI